MNRGNAAATRGVARVIAIWGPWLLILLGVLYYASYYNAGIYPAAEGGNEGVNALRLMAGQRPIADTFLGYNVLWFYPVVWMFQITGPSYTVLRVFFLVLCLITGLLSFRILLRCGRSPWVALLGGALVIVVPGQMYRNYMAFLAVLNLFVLLPAYVLPAKNTATRLVWMLAAGLVLGITFLIRIDLGYFFLLILLGLALVFPLAPEAAGGVWRRGLLSLLGLLLGLLGVFAVHLPVVIDAERRGFGREFAAQYEQWPHMIASQTQRIGGMIRSGLLSHAPSLLYPWRAARPPRAARGRHHSGDKGLAATRLPGRPASTGPDDGDQSLHTDPALPRHCRCRIGLLAEGVGHYP